MSSILKVRADVYRKLRQPSEKSTADGAYIDEAAIEVCDELHTDVNQSNQAWFMRGFNLNVTTDRDEYNIDNLAPDFGKGRYIYTIDESDANFVRRAIPIMEYEDLQKYYDQGFPAVNFPSNLKHTAQAMAFIYDGANKIVLPTKPQQDCQYRVIYEPDIVRPGSPQEQVIRFRQFDWYVADKIAFRVLPIVWWDDFEGIQDPVQREIANNTRRSDIAKYLAADIARGDQQFWRFRQSNRDTKTYRTEGFGARRW